MTHRLSAVLALFILSACGTETAPETTAETALDDSAELATLLDDYFERNLVLSPTSATSIGDDRYDDKYTNSIGPSTARHGML